MVHVLYKKILFHGRGDGNQRLGVTREASTHEPRIAVGGRNGLEEVEGSPA